jgi:hypothetical protein
MDFRFGGWVQACLGPDLAKHYAGMRLLDHRLAAGSAAAGHDIVTASSLYGIPGIIPA